jgi:hypothetical protein
MRELEFGGDFAQVASITQHRRSAAERAASCSPGGEGPIGYFPNNSTVPKVSEIEVAAEALRPPQREAQIC